MSWTPLAPDAGWQASFHGADRLERQRYADADGGAIDVAIAYYTHQRADAEAVYHANRTYDGERWQRAHGNLVEHAPMVLVVMYILERAYGSGPPVKVIGVTFVIARLLHAYGTAMPSRYPKMVGAALTYLVELALGAVLLTRMIQTLGH